MSEEKNGLHLVMFPFFAYGHITPFVQLSNKLSSSHGVKISFLTTPRTVNRITATLTPSSTTQVIPLAFPTVQGLPSGVENTADSTMDGQELLKVALDLMQPQITTLLSQLNPDFVVFDFAQDWLPSIATELNIKTIYFNVFITLSTPFISIPELMTTPSARRLKELPPGVPNTLAINSVKSFEASHFEYVFTSFYDMPSVGQRMMTGLNGCTAILLKTSMEMEGAYVDYTITRFQKPVLLAGPVVPEPPTGELEEKWAKWLGQFEQGSVIYCSFGSETFLSDDQITELALGLEQTGFPFFLVLNFTANLNRATELKRVLPEGFLERVKHRGVVHSGWVQQQLILAHTSVGCYVCHAGFSSVIEAMVNDCQLVMLPIKGDQYLNSKLLDLDLKAGVEVNRRDQDGYFGKDDVCEAVKKVMVDVEQEPGKSIRANHKKWKEFLLNKEIQDKFVTDLVEDMKAMADIKS